MLTSPTDSMLTMSILLMPLYCEICLAPAFALASVPFAVIDIAAPPRPFKRRRMPPPPPLPAPPPSTAPSWRVRPVPRFSRFVRLRFAVGSVVTSCGSRLIRCSGEVVLTSGTDPLTVTLSSMAPTSRANLRLTFCAAPSRMPLTVCVLKPASVTTSL